MGITSHKELRPHQVDAVRAIGGKTKGKVILPTGTGKSYIEFEAIRLRIKKLQKENKYGGVHVILSPRILLAFQLLDTAAQYLTNHKIQALYLNINSGEFSAGELIAMQSRLGLQPEHVESTTSIAGIKESVRAANKRNLPLVIACTYHSADQLRFALNQLRQKGMDISVDYTMYDEAQYTVDNNEFSQTLKDDAFGKYFFTATPRTTDADDGRGMNNEDLYGEVIFTKTPATMIKAGEMVGPAIHLVGVKGDYAGCDLTQDYKNVVNAIREAFVEHRKAVKRYAAGGSQENKIGAKMMVVCDGQKAIRGIYNAPEFNTLRQEMPEIKIYMLCTDFGIYMNGKQYPDARNRYKEELLEQLHSLKLEDDAIIVHVDMLAEGIDVPGITGIMPFRNMGDSKFLQNLGRGTRLHIIDRAMLYGELIKPGEYEKYIKPFCWLILPVFLANSVDFTDRYLVLVERVRYEYEITSSELVILDNSNAASVMEPIPEAGNDLAKQIRTARTQIVDFIHDLEDADFIGTLAEKTFNAKKMGKREMFTRLCYIMFMKGKNVYDN